MSDNPYGPLWSGDYQALTIWQPWAHFIVKGWKPYEFRGWAPPASLMNGQPMAIHAGKTVIKRPEVTALIYRLERGGDQARATGLTHHEEVVKVLHQLLAAPNMLPRGVMLGACTVDRGVSVEHLAVQWDVAFVNDSTRDNKARWGWPLTMTEIFSPPYPDVKGHESLWPWRKPRSRFPV